MSKIGLDIVQKDQNLKINLVRDGLVMKWNSDQPGQAIKPGDLIVEVNGVRDDFEKILQTVSKDTSLDMLVRRKQ